MATIVNTPREDTGSGFGVLLGIVLALVLAILFFVYGLPYIQRTTAPATNDTGTNINVTVPNIPGTGSESGTGGTNQAPSNSAAQ